MQDPIHDSSPAAVPFTGGCVCGSVRYECGSPPALMLNCHCRDCQQVGGGPYAPIVVVPLSSFRLTRGTLRHHCTTMLNGKENVRGFCSRCGSRLTVGEDRKRNLIGLLAGSLDAPALFRPCMEIFVCDAQEWNPMNPDLPKHPHYMARTETFPENQPDRSNVPPGTL